MTEKQHRAFSFRRISAITGNTLTELTRQKVFYVVLIFALVLIGNSIFMARLTFQQESQVLKDVSLGAMSIFTSLLAIISTARLIPQETEDRTIYTILAKPVTRLEYLCGKLAGVLALLALSAFVMSALFFLSSICGNKLSLAKRRGSWLECRPSKLTKLCAASALPLLTRTCSPALGSFT